MKVAAITMGMLAAAAAAGIMALPTPSNQDTHIGPPLQPVRPTKQVDQFPSQLFNPPANSPTQAPPVQSPLLPGHGGPIPGTIGWGQILV